MSDAILMASGADDIDFMIHGLFSYELFGHKVWITTTHVCVLIVMLVLIGFAFVINRKMKHATDVDGMVENVMGENSRKFKNYISTIFLFILFSNISGLFGLRPPTADYGTTLAMALITFTMITFCKFKYQKVKGVLQGLCDPWPFWAPINIIGDLAVPVSLSLRLFANVLSGTVIMALIYGLLAKIAIAWPAALHVYFDLFSGAIQTYVFCMLTMTYVTQACETDE